MCHSLMQSEDVAGRVRDAPSLLVNTGSGDRVDGYPHVAPNLQQ